MEDILYLAHVIPNKNILDKILRYGGLKTNGEFYDQFPGVFFTLITRSNINTERLFFPAKYILLFSRKLLYQNNYHFNYLDYNGIITNKTLFPWTLNNMNHHEVLGDNFIGNEVVFHDDVSIDFLCKIVEIPENLTKSINTRLPKTPLENDALPDESLLPFVLYVDYHIYTGIPQAFYSDVADKKFIKTIAKVANLKIHGNTSIDRIIEIIKTKYKFYYKHRDKQNLKLLM